MSKRKARQNKDAIQNATQTAQNMIGSAQQEANAKTELAMETLRHANETKAETIEAAKDTAKQIINDANLKADAAFKHIVGQAENRTEVKQYNAGS